MESSFHVSLTREEVAAMLAELCLPVDPSSPLAAIPPMESPTVLAALRAKNLVDAFGVPISRLAFALLVLTGNGQQVRLVLGDGARWGLVSYVYDPEGQCVSLSSQGDEIVITLAESSAANQSIVQSVEGWLRSSNLAEPDPLQLQLEPRELAAFAAVVDAARAAQLRHLLQRKVPSSAELPVDALHEAVLAGTQSQDSRWLVTLIANYGPSEFRPEATELAAGARRLAERGWLRITSSGVLPGPEAERACAVFANTVPFVAVQFRNGAKSQATVLACRTQTALALIDFETGSKPPAARIMTAGSGLFRQMLSTRLPRPSQPATPQNRCGACGAAVASGNRFCPQCGTPYIATSPAPAAPPPSPQRTNPAPVAPQPVTNAPRACSKCGKPLTPGHKFCRSCGQPVL